MSTSKLSRYLLAPFVLMSVASAQTFFVSPTGTDQVGFGLTTNTPFKTIQYAVTTGALPHQAATIVLMDGTFSAATNGETFPILFPNNKTISIYGQNPGKTKVVGPTPAGSTMFELRNFSSTFKDFDVATGGTFVRVTTGIYSLTLENLDVEAGSGLRWSTRDWSINRYLDVINCDLDCTNDALYVSVGSSQGNLQYIQGHIAQSKLRGSAGSALEAVTLVPEASINFDIDGTVLHGSNTGIQTNLVQGYITMQTYNCTFYDNGGPFAPSGSIVDLVPGVNQGVFDCLFSSDVLDRNMPSYNANSYQVFGCVLQQTAPAIPNQIVAPAPLVDPANGDFHLLPNVGGSHPAIDSASYPSSPMTDDMDGDPSVSDCAMDLRDVGADEFIAHYIYSVTDPSIGEVATLRLFGDPNAQYAIYLFAPASQPVPHTLCTAPAATPTDTFLVAVTTNAQGLAEFSVPITNPAWIGQTLGFKAIGGTGGQWTSNVAKMLIKL